MYCKALLINAVQFAQQCSDKAEVTNTIMKKGKQNTFTD